MSRRRAIGFEIFLPKVDIDALARRVAGSPQFARFELDAVTMLRIRALTVRVRIRKNENAPVVADDAVLTACVARNPRMALRIHVARDDFVANREARLVTPVVAKRDAVRLRRRPLVAAMQH